ncbi:glycoside hydrolase [Schizophyllum commune Loenen D]|nr:glycoside hydrolase [Schizophyllum commune Loenen D]
MRAFHCFGVSAFSYALCARAAASSSSYAPSSATSDLTPTATTSAATSDSPPAATTTSNASLPLVGSISPDFSDIGLELLWGLVLGAPKEPLFTTTATPTTTALPSPPPPLYPAFYAPAPKDILPDLKFPSDFKFGVASASYQVEGATKKEGKGPTMWNFISHVPFVIADGTNGDIVDLHYYLHKEDVARAAALGLNAHSFSLSWARIFPFGKADSRLNQEGLDHYSDVIDTHLEHGVEPVVTLFHWDLPLALQLYYGGFTSPKIVDDFVKYVQQIALVSRLALTVTFNEPLEYCNQIAAFSIFTPGVNISTAPFHCAYNLRGIRRILTTCAAAFREMNITGEIGLKNDDFIGTPWRANNTEDIEAVERHAAFQIGLYSDPIYTTGDWPQILKDTLSEEYLPRFTEEEKADLLGSADFYAIDSYRSSYVRAPEGGLEACVNNPSDPNWPQCNEAVLYDGDQGWLEGPAADPRTDWLASTPQGVRGLLNELQKRWPSPKIYVSEFGFAEPLEDERKTLAEIKEDVGRTNYYMTYLGEILQAIHEDGLPIGGIFAWAMVDNAEWVSGLAVKFGIQHVNYTTFERTYKRSAFALSEFWGTRTRPEADGC